MAAELADYFPVECPANLFIEQPSAGPIRALRLHHPTKKWTYDPDLVWGSRMDDFDRGEDRIRRVDRARAEELAHLFEAPLPGGCAG